MRIVFHYIKPDTQEAAATTIKVFAIIAAFEKVTGTRVTIFQDYTAGEYRLLRERLEVLAAKHVLLGIGADGIEWLNEICNFADKNEVLSIWVGEKVTLDNAPICDKLDIIAVPDHEKSELTDIGWYTTAEVISLLSPLHDIQDEDLEYSLQIWQQPFLPAENYLAVFLGGDTVEDKVIRTFGAEQAKKFANYIAFKAKMNKAVVLVANCGRTGQYNPLTLRERRYAQDANDVTSQAFINELGVHKILFQFEKYTRTSQSPLYPFIAQVKKHNGHCYVTGDCSNIIGQIIDALPMGKVTIVAIDSMKSTQHKQMDTYFTHKSASVLYFSEAGSHLKPLFSRLGEVKDRSMRATEQIARAIYDHKKIQPKVENADTSVTSKLAG